MIELSVSEFHKARSIFEPLMAHQMFCAGVLEGLYPGRIFVDDKNNPQSGLASKDGVWWFLAGESHNETFNTAVNRALFDRTLSGEKGWGGMMVCHPADWDDQIPVLYSPHIPITTQRLHYTCRQIHADWRAHIPDGFEIRFVDSTLSDDGIDAHGAAANVLHLRREASEPDQKAVGFVAVHERKIVASSVIDCIVNRGGDIGLYTDDAYRRRGLAALTAAAVIGYALSHGLEVVHWDCHAFNTGSIRTAEKLGLQLIGEHTMYNLILNPVLHEVNRAWSHFDAGRYAQALGVCQQHIQAGPEPAHPHFHYVMARCFMESNRSDEAAQALERAVQCGWDSIEEATADFPALASHGAWDDILKRIQENVQAGESSQNH